MTITEAELASLTFGCELEYEGISQSAAARTVAETVGGTARYEGRHLSNWVVEMPDGRKWQIVSDGSLCGSSAEVVTPILRIADMDTLQKVVRAMRRARAKVNARTGLHVHVGAQGMSPAQIKNLVKTFYKQEELILKAAGTQPTRIARYTRKTDHAFVDKICRLRKPTMNAINLAWFGRYTPHPYHYDDHRYRALNLNNLWNDKGTVEFRYHEQSLNAGKIRAAVLLDLLIVLRAKMAKASSAKNPRPYSEASAKYDFRVFLLRLGAIGPYFKNPRKHLMANLPGSAAWKDGRHD
ncbi:MAG: amidoligase family protein [Kiritimatiellae bacterium]|nr:amidoligase family protein [Kiritimatiellia bacterium]